MTLSEDLAEWLNSKLSVGHGGLEAWGLKIHACVDEDKLVVHCHFAKMPYRDTGVPGDGLNSSRNIQCKLLENLGRSKAEERVLREVLHWLRYIVEHEVMESLLWEGQRRWDPHAGQ